MWADLEPDVLAHYSEPPLFDYELGALRIITRDSLGKGPCDWTSYHAGWAHFQQPDPLRLGLTSPETRRLLASDRSGAVQLHRWRQIVRSALAEAWASGCTSEACLAVTAAIANTSPGLARELGRRAKWRWGIMLKLYVMGRPTVHRQRRAQAVWSLYGG